MTLFLPSQGGIMPMSSSIWTDALELCCCRRLLRVPWITRRSNQSILKKINPEYSLEGLMLKLKLQYFVYLMQTAESLEKTLMLGKIEGRKTKGRQRVRWFNDIIGSMGMSLNKVWEVVKNKGAWHAAVHGVPKSLTWLRNWMNWILLYIYLSIYILHVYNIVHIIYIYVYIQINWYTKWHIYIYLHM